MQKRDLRYWSSTYSVIHILIESVRESKTYFPDFAFWLRICVTHLFMLELMYQLRYSGNRNAE